MVSAGLVLTSQPSHHAYLSTLTSCLPHNTHIMLTSRHPHANNDGHTSENLSLQLTMLLPEFDDSYHFLKFIYRIVDYTF